MSFSQDAHQGDEARIWVKHLIVDPKWRLFRLNLGNLPVLRIYLDHDRHHDFALSDNTLVELHSALCRMICEIGVTE